MCHAYDFPIGSNAGTKDLSMRVIIICYLKNTLTPTQGLGYLSKSHKFCWMKLLSHFLTSMIILLSPCWRQDNDEMIKLPYLLQI